MRTTGNWVRFIGLCNLVVGITLFQGIFRASLAAEVYEPVMLLSASIPSASQGLLLKWPLDTNACSYEIGRTPLISGVVSNSHWTRLAEIEGGATQYIDATARLGQAYEYAVKKFYTERFQLKEVGSVIAAGRDLPLKDKQGQIVLLVDQSQEAALSHELNQLIQDLTVEGWRVHRQDVSRSNTPYLIWQLIKSYYDSDPIGTQAVLLLGKIPALLTTQTNAPGAHDLITTWPEDAVYGAMDPGVFDEQGNYRNQNWPVRLAVGRIDLSEMPSFAPLNETELLRRYLMKNHQFRHHLLDLPNRAILDDRFGGVPHREPALLNWMILSSLVSADHIKLQECLPTLSQEGYLWLVAGGFSSPTDAGSAISTFHFRDADPQIGYAIFYGSLLGNWIYPDNILRAVLASPHYGLASIYGLQMNPSYLHRMGLGETIGECIRAQQQASQTRYCINLMGDPTLRLHQVMPPSRVRQATLDAGIQLSWEASKDPEVAGYHVYRSSFETGPFDRLTDKPVTDLSFLDRERAPGSSCYMVSAIKLVKSSSGSYWNASPGISVKVEKSTPQPVVSIHTSTPRILSHWAYPGLCHITCDRVQEQPLSMSCLIKWVDQYQSNYTQVETNVTIEAGFSEGILKLNPEHVTGGRSISTDGETVTISLSPKPGYQIGASGHATLVIEPEEEIQVVAIPDLVKVGSSATAAFRFSRSSPASDSLSIHFGLSGTAIPGLDFVELTKTVMLPKGAAAVTLPLTILGLSKDWPAEGRKTIILNLQPGQGYRLGADQEAAISILKDDPLPIVEILASIPDAHEAGLIPGEFTLMRTGNLHNNLTVFLLRPEGTATGRDYTNSLPNMPRIPIAIPFGQASIAIPVLPLDNQTLDPDKPLIYKLASDASYAIGGAKSATVVIRESNAVGIPRLVIHPREMGFVKPLREARMEISRSGGTLELPVLLSFGGSATNGYHYELLPETFTIPAGSNSAPLMFRPIPQGEGDKVIEVILLPSSRYHLGNPSRNTVPIRDSAYDAWSVQQFGRQLTNAPLSGRKADPDGDGNCNFIEFLFDLNPLQPDQIRPGDLCVQKDRFFLNTYLVCRNIYLERFTTQVQYTTNLLLKEWRNLDGVFPSMSYAGEERNGYQLMKVNNTFRMSPELGSEVFVRFIFDFDE